ncbi:hypothetical protein BGV67_02695 [Burkholderia ubonensis]|uniref:lysozyme inhibitor LprI family protein n=1 Tax=Burkholderia ubonensis TaxID=101571 RepID=UPI00075F4C9A|nr:lysozyme inhibitor LprI family protein [Burkholderia ubonensis]KVG35099.1 hypothetical protein WJ31_22150 [Burkholderia ubonensis]KVU63692.1 hypothetical protein WK72_21635 [Burkholderia ubonensis]KVZ19000.1 hypothetical protein WL13_09475 [Burkholderia ubonensis]KWB56042.1 hypothetical protein WL37_31880 [Burkholderia ubonensis]KWE97111.1 hypothetical protein WL82_25880 [Burkholderia ubonensis]
MKKFSIVKQAAVGILIAAAVTSAHAATKQKPVDPIQQCFDQAQNVEQKSVCYDKAITVQKKRLNAAYNVLIKHYGDNKEKIDKLNQMQKGWIAWRDRTYNFLSEGVAGGFEAVFSVSHEFMLDAVTQQAALLETIKDMEGGE